VEYGKSIGHVLNEISNTTRYIQLANIRYNNLATKDQQTEKCDNKSSHKNYSATLWYTAKAGPAIIWKNPLLSP